MDDSRAAHDLSGRDLHPDLTRDPSSDLPESPPRYHAVARAGWWVPWVGLGLAVAWWGAVTVALITTIDITVLGRQSPMILGAGAVIAILPGAILLFAAFLARENARRTAATGILLEAADRLLSPHDAIRNSGARLADDLKAQASEVEQAMRHALTGMKAMSEQVGDERLRLESVSYATADNARDLAERLGEERKALESLARELRAQTDAMTDAIPRQAELMKTAALAAGEEIGRAEQGLEARLEGMRALSATLSEQLSQLAALSETADREGRSTSEVFSRMETRLDEARRTLDQAVQAGEMAAAAANATSEALTDAVTAALEGARRANTEISVSSRQAQADAAVAFTRLRERAEEANAALQAVNRTATSAPLHVATGNGKAPTQPAVNARSWPRGDDDLFEDAEADPRRDQDDRRLAEDHPEVTLRPRFQPDAQTAPDWDDDLMDEADDEDSERDMVGVDPAASPTPIQRASSPAPDPGPVGGGRSIGWSSILTDMDREANGQLPREETAEAVISKLETSGIQLASVFRSKTKKKVAAAARRGEAARRNAILASVGDEVERVRKRLRADDELAHLAEDFVALEEPDAMAALDRTQKSGRNASPRLSAFLLLDAAIAQRTAEAI